MDDLLNRYLDDRSALSAEELDELIALLRDEPARAVRLREQLVLDDLLAQKLAVDRRNFAAQVGQRIADFERGQDELDQQVHELRELAEAEIERPQTWTGSSPWVKYVLALSAAALIGGLFFGQYLLPPQRVHVAKVTAVAGDVQIEQGGQSAAAALNAGLLSGQQLVVPAGGSIDVTYQDATVVRLGENSAVTFDFDRATGAKQVRMVRGELIAQIQPQTEGAMVFSTPHATATVLGTRLRLQVSPTQTLLDVTEGRVQFDRLTGGPSHLVAAHESGVATAEEFHVQALEWPEQKKAIAFLLSPLKLTEHDSLPVMAARSPESGNLRVTELQPRGAVRLLETSCWELAGGSLISEEAGPDLRAAFASSSEFTLEAAFTPAAANQPGMARIAALAEEDGAANFALSQEGNELLFLLRTERAADEVVRFPLLAPDEPLAQRQQPRHLTITYQGSELVAYLNGGVVARHHAERGPLAHWRDGPLTLGATARGEHAWHGQVEALVLYNRCLTPTEIARSVTSYRLLVGRGM